MYKDNTYDEMMDEAYGEAYMMNFDEAKAEDLMEVGIREESDVEQIPDCDSREDFLELASLQRTEEHLVTGEYFYGNNFEMKEYGYGN